MKTFEGAAVGIELPQRVTLEIVIGGCFAERNQHPVDRERAGAV